VQKKKKAAILTAFANSGFIPVLVFAKQGDCYAFFYVQE